MRGRGDVIVTFKHFAVNRDTTDYGASEIGGIAVPVIVGDVIAATDPIDDESSGSHIA